MDDAPQSGSGECSLPPADGQSFVDSVVVPGAALLMSNIMIYSGAASFVVRPNPERRLALISGAVFLGVFLGGLFFPRLSAWALDKDRKWRRSILVAWLVVALLSVLPGLQQYAFNEPLRIVANLLLGLQVAPAYLLYFSRVPGKWRGTGFGACLGAGLLCWNIFMSIANAYPAVGDAPFHPLLASVYLVHTSSIAILAVLCLYALAFFPRNAPEPIPYFAPVPGRSKGGGPVRIVMSTAFAVYFLSGVLDAKFVPTIPSFSSTSFSRVPTILATLAAPLIGWLLDRRPVFLFHRIVPISCWSLILAPSLVVIGHSHNLYGILQAFTTVGQFCFFILSSIVLAGLAASAGEAVWHSLCIYAIRVTAIAVHIVWSRIFDVGEGTTVLVAVALAYMVSQLAKRLEFTIAHGIEPVQGGIQSVPDDSVADANVTTVPAKSLATFVEAGGLSPREQEAAKLLLEGYTLDAMAGIMGISARTVKKHTVGIYHKYNVGNRHEYYRCYTHYLLEPREKGEETPGIDDARE